MPSRRRHATFRVMPSRPKGPAFVLLDDLDDDELVQVVVKRTTSVEARDVKLVLEVVSQLAREDLPFQIVSLVDNSSMYVHDDRIATGAARKKSRRRVEEDARAAREDARARTAREEDARAARIDQEDLRQRFEKYADEWRAQTAHFSVLSQRIMHPSYQMIIGLGPDALPLIIERLLTRPDHWFWALRSIAGEDEDPVRREDVGKFAVMRAVWLHWGQRRGLI